VTSASNASCVGPWRVADRDFRALVSVPQTGASWPVRAGNDKRSAKSPRYSLVGPQPEVGW